MKKQRSFTLTYPLTHKVVRDLKIVDELAATFTVEGVQYPSGDVDIEFVWYGGEDLRAILEAVDYLDTIAVYCETALKNKEVAP
jgi:hypothetical protein